MSWRLGLGMSGLAGLCLVLLGCSAPASTPIRFGSDASTQTIAGLGACRAGLSTETRLDPDRPLTILVHGCNASGGRFGALAEVFELHEQQSLCFRYNDRARITNVAQKLRSAIDEVSKRMRDPQVIVLGHSQGGLIARAALSDRFTADATQARYGRVRLVTVSSPFAGIRAASHCGSTMFHVLSLGQSMAACRVIAGAKWRDIHHKAALVREPGQLAPFVEQHLEVVTDELNSCRTLGADGACLHDDFVFSIGEQRNPRVEADRRVAREVIAAGHVEIVGSESVEPQKLVKVLQQAGVLVPTPPEKRVALQALFERLF